jgi:hypothetical protein
MASVRWIALALAMAWVGSGCVVRPYPAYYRGGYAYRHCAQAYWVEGPYGGYWRCPHWGRY